jgi:hypothetical protein
MRNIVLCALALGGVALAAADDGGSQQAAARQEQIRGEAQGLVSRLDEVIAEYRRNGLAKGQDFQSLEDVRAALGSLSEQQMEEVVALLKQQDGDAGRMAKAYAGEKDISLRLKQILAAHENEQDIADLARAVRELADRQKANLTTTIDTRLLATQDPSANGQAAVTASLEAQQSEQGAIAGEVKLLADKLGKIATEAKEKDAATELAQAPADAAGAADDLGASRMDDAVTAEDAARGKLEDVARALAPAAEPEAGAGRTAAQLGDLARQERALAQQTGQAAGALEKATDAQSPDAAEKAMYDQMQLPHSTVARSLAKDGITSASSADEIRSAPAMKAFLQARAAALAAQAQAAQAQMTTLSAAQAALAAKAQMAREELGTDAKEAAPMENALAQMNSAQQALAKSDGQQATQGETAAASQLDQAQRLAQQTAANGAPPTPAEQAAESAPERQELAKEMAGLGKVIGAQQQLGLDTEKAGDSPKQSLAKAKQLAGRQAAVQKQAEDAGLGITPPAATQAIAKADAAMGDAAQKLTGDGAQQAEPAQQAALAALYQAQDALADQMKSLAGGPGQGPAQARSTASEALTKAQQQTASAQSGMAPAASGQGTMQHAATQLAQAERTMGQAAGQAAELPDAARDAIRAAQQALAEAAAAAGAGESQQAAAQAAQAGADMAAAQSALGEAQAGIAGSLAAAGNGVGQPSDSSAPQGNSGSQQPGAPGPGQNPGMNQATAGEEGASEKGWKDQGGAAKTAAGGATGTGQYVGLPERDRAAIEQSQAEKYPQEYGSMIEEYMRSLAGDSGGK